MAKKRTGDPWMPADVYGRRLPRLSVNLLVKDVARSVPFYTGVLGAKLHYSDADFAALELNGIEFMLHADHTYDQHPWYGALVAGVRRGLGAEMRLLGVNPDEVESHAQDAHAVILRPAADKGHGWREVMVEDPDGYVWAVGLPIHRT